MPMPWWMCTTKSPGTRSAQEVMRFPCRTNRRRDRRRRHPRISLAVLTGTAGVLTGNPAGGAPRAQGGRGEVGLSAEGLPTAEAQEDLCIRRHRAAQSGQYEPPPFREQRAGGSPRNMVLLRLVVRALQPRAGLPGGPGFLVERDQRVWGEEVQQGCGEGLFRFAQRQQDDLLALADAARRRRGKLPPPPPLGA